MENRIKRFDPFALVVGILSVIVAVMALRNPLPTFSAVVVIAAIISILSGLYKLFSVRPYLSRSGWFTFSAILDIIIGLLMLFNDAFGATFVAIAFAIMFLSNSFVSLRMANVLRPVSQGYFWLDVIISILGIILGIMLLISPILSVLSLSYMIALLFMTFGISLIAHSL